MGKRVGHPAHSPGRLHERRELFLWNLGASFDFEPLVAKLTPGADPSDTDFEPGQFAAALAGGERKGKAEAAGDGRGQQFGRHDAGIGPSVLHWLVDGDHVTSLPRAIRAFVKQIEKRK